MNMDISISDKNQVYAKIDELMAIYNKFNNIYDSVQYAYDSVNPIWNTGEDSESYKKDLKSNIDAMKNKLIPNIKDFATALRNLMDEYGGIGL